MPSLDFVRCVACAASSAIRRHASSRWSGAQKNAVRGLRTSAPRLVRPHACGACAICPAGDHARLSRVRSAAGRLPALRRREARAARLSWPTIRSTPSASPSTSAAAAARHDQGRRRGAAPRLAHGQGAGQAVHARATGPCRHAGAQGASASTRSRSARATPTASWSAI